MASSRVALLHRSGRAAAEDSKSVHIYPLDVPKGLLGLTLKFDYSPRVAEDRARNAVLVEAALEKHDRRREAIKTGIIAEHRREFSGLYRSLNNLMNVVLIDPDGRWRGRWDRNPSSDQGELVLSRERSSKGFLPGEIKPGRWSVAIECHGIFGDPVSYELDVQGLGSLEGIDAALDSPASAGKAAQARQRRSGPGWYFGEMHSHTVHSDGKHELLDLAERATALGLDFVALTDHNTTSGLLEDQAFPLTIVPGCELTTFHGHHPIYGLNDIIPWHLDGRVRSLAELAPLIRGMGGVVSVAHPFKIGDPICTGCRMPDDLDPQSFDLFEVWYRRWDSPETDNEAAYALWNQYWRSGRRITAVAARDWHGPSQEGPFPGPMAFTGVRAQDNSPQAIVEGLKRGAVIMSGGPIMDFALEASDGRRAIVGESLSAPAATMRLGVERLAEPAELRLFKNGERIHTSEVRGDGAYAFEGLAVGPGWYRAELWRGELPRCLTNHALLA